MVKVKTAVSIDYELLEWIEMEARNGRFASKSHGISWCVRIVRDRKIT